jgi:hypothetical protein
MGFVEQGTGKLPLSLDWAKEKKPLKKRLELLSQKIFSLFPRSF